jgi:hypothetical protein
MGPQEHFQKMLYKAAVPIQAAPASDLLTGSPESFYSGSLAPAAGLQKRLLLPHGRLTAYIFFMLLLSKTLS